MLPPRRGGATGPALRGRGRRRARGGPPARLPPAPPAPPAATSAAPPSSTAAPGCRGRRRARATNAGDIGREAAAPRQRGGQVNSRGRMTGVAAIVFLLQLLPKAEGQVFAGECRPARPRPRRGCPLPRGAARLCPPAPPRPAPPGHLPGRGAGGSPRQPKLFTSSLPPAPRPGRELPVQSPGAGQGRAGSVPRKAAGGRGKERSRLKVGFASAAGARPKPRRCPGTSAGLRRGLPRAPGSAGEPAR